MNPTRDLSKYLLLTLAGAWACAEREPQPTQTPADESESLRERKAGRDRELATPPGDREAARRACEYPLTTYCFAPGELQKTLKDCKHEKSTDDNGCMTLASYRACTPPIADGPRFDGAQCCYSACQQPALPGGRPLVTIAGARRAPPIARSDWHASVLDDDRSSSFELRRDLALAWREDALAEHASVASFARFVLELVSVGAPPELIRDAMLAGLDEIEHARLCFGLAARFAGEPCGPGALELDGVAPRSTLREIVIATVTEGCATETIGACVAAHQLAACEDRDTARVLEKIAQEEAKHAALAWRFVAWALAVDPALMNEVEAALHDDLEFATVESSSDPGAWRSFGRLTKREISEIAASTRRDVIQPCLDALRRYSGFASLDPTTSPNSVHG